MFSLICPVNHSIPSCRPSPVVALLAQMCQGLSNNLSRPEIRPADEIHCKHWFLPRVCDTLTLDIESLRSILFAKNSMGNLLAWMSGCCNFILRNHDNIQRSDDHLQQHVQLILGHHHPQPVAGVHHEDDALAVSVVVLPQVPVSPLARHIKCCEPNIAIWNYLLGQRTLEELVIMQFRWWSRPTLSICCWSIWRFCWVILSQNQHKRLLHHCLTSQSQNFMLNSISPSPTWLLSGATEPKYIPSLT